MIVLAVLFSVLGTWHGTLHQAGTKPFTVTVAIHGTTAAVRYSGLDCRGTWKLISHRGATYRFRETITAGRSASCTGTGVVTLKVSGRRLDYTFRGGGVVSRGVLRRR